MKEYSEMDKYYQILGLNPGASEKEIIEAYKVLIKVWHPNRFSDDSSIQKIATEKTKEIDEAFKQVLIWAGTSAQKENEIPEPQLEVVAEPSETKGRIVVKTEPEDSVIIINEQPVGMGSYERTDLPIGLYKIRAIKEGYEIWEQEINIKAGAKQEVFAELKLKEPRSKATYPTEVQAQRAPEAKKYDIPAFPQIDKKNRSGSFLG